MQEQKQAKQSYDKLYRAENKQRIAQYKKEWQFKHKDDPELKIKRNLRRRIHHVLNGVSKSASTLTLLGCSFEQFKQYIESRFTKGMTWDNYGPNGWHIDHIKPCHTFDLTDPKQQRECFHYSNQRPLWAKENLSRPRQHSRRRSKKKTPTVESLR